MSKDKKKINAYIIFAGNQQNLTLSNRFYGLTFNHKKAIKTMNKIEGTVIQTEVDREKLRNLI